MRIIPSCEQCLYDKQKHIAETLENTAQREAFLAEVRHALDTRKAEDSAPYMVYVFKKLLAKYCVPSNAFADIKKEYNSLMLAMEKEIEKNIEEAADPLETSILYSRVGNYIDFGAMNHVEQSVLMEMLQKETRIPLDTVVYHDFLADCEKGNRFLLLCDNCGEIVLDKLFLKQLHKRFPHLKLYTMVRGEDVLNDATMEDALQSGINTLSTVISNGNGVAGTVVELLSPKAAQILEEADVILSKGQGNYESFSGYPKTVYYSFLCKCDLFVSKFRSPRLTGMFIKETDSFSY